MRYSLYPIKYHNLYNLYKKHRNLYWQPEEIDLTKDITQWEYLDEDEKNFIANILAFFNTADGIVMKNIDMNFSKDVEHIAEAKAFLAFQGGMEAVHNETYGLLLETLIKDPKLREYYQNGIENVTSVKKKADWAIEWMNDERSFPTRLLAFICVEGILFSGSFCAIYWLKKSNKLPGLCFSNELIAKDEALHTQFTIELFLTIEKENKIGNERLVPEDEVHKIFKEAVSNEKEFINESLPCRLIGMNSDLMSQYIEYVADYILELLHYTPIYNRTNPFDFMEAISLNGKTNFFERRVGEYSKNHSIEETNENVFSLNDDF